MEIVKSIPRISFIIPEHIPSITTCICIYCFHPLNHGTYVSLNIHRPKTSKNQSPCLWMKSTFWLGTLRQSSIAMGNHQTSPKKNRSFYWQINYTCWNFRRTMLHCQKVNHNFTQWIRYVSSSNPLLLALWDTSRHQLVYAGKLCPFWALRAAIQQRGAWPGPGKQQG